MRDGTGRNRRPGLEGARTRRRSRPASSKQARLLPCPRPHRDGISSPPFARTHRDHGATSLTDPLTPDPPHSTPLPSPVVSIAEAEDPNRPRRTLGFRDLLLFYVVTGISLRWIATAAAAGPSSIVIWIGAWLVFYTPLALSVIELSSRYPSEGGIYVWTKRAFGDFSGFMSAWTYWTCNLPYFPAVLYFAASNALYMRRDAWAHLSNNTTFYIVFSLLALALATLLNIFGLDVGSWLHNIGAVAMWIPVSIVFAMGL